MISEKKNNVLYNISKKFKLNFIEHKGYIGGRYSVLSEVGLIPAYLMGLNITKFRKRILSHLIKKTYLIKTALKLANIFQQKSSKYYPLKLLTSPRQIFILVTTVNCEGLEKKNKVFANCIHCSKIITVSPVIFRWT